MQRNHIITLIGNVVEHYDAALFGLLAPFIAPLFFERSDPLTALILTYGMLPLGIIFRPIGSFLFGWIGDRYGRRKALFFSLFGMGCATAAMGCLPTYATAGICAPLLLALCRIAQNCCAAGECVGGAIFILEHAEESRKNVLSSLYGSSTIAGILLASFFVMLGSEHWRALYLSGGIAAFVGMAIRYQTTEGKEFTKMLRLKQTTLRKIIQDNRAALLAIICTAGFSYTTYALPFVMMNGFIPLVTSVSATEVMRINTLLLVCDMCLLPYFGHLASRYSKQKIMLASALIAFLTSFPLFYLLKGATLATIILIRVLIVLIGTAFSATYHAWAQELVTPQHRYTVLSLGHSIGTQLIGVPTAFVSLWLFQKTGWTGSPALYIMLSSLLAAISILKLQAKTRSVAT